MRPLALALAVAAALSATSSASAQITVSPRMASIRLGGRLHAQYASSSVVANESQFFFRRARLTADIAVNDFFDARISPEFVGSGAALKDAYLRFRFAPALQVTVGQFKRPFDLFELDSSTDMSIIERDGRVPGVAGCGGVGGICSYSRMTEKLSFSGRDLGVRVGGRQGKVSYALALTNGAGENSADENGAKSFTGHVSLAIAPGVVLSGQAGFHDYPLSESQDAHAAAWGADVQIGGWRDGLMLQASAVRGDNWKMVDGSGGTPSFTTFQTVASYYAPVGGGRFTAVEPVVRISYGDPDATTSADGGYVVTPGLMFYVLGKNKVGFNVDVWYPESGPTAYSLKMQSFLYF